MAATFAGNPLTTVIVVAYAPTEEKPKTSPHNILVIAGDFNARMGEDRHQSNPRVIAKHVLHKAANDNGSRLVEFCEATNTRPIQPRFPHPKSRIWTWQPDANRNAKDGKNRAQLDHILANGKWINLVKNVRAYDTIDLGSDHRIEAQRSRSACEHQERTRTSASSSTGESSKTTRSYKNNIPSKIVTTHLGEKTTMMICSQNTIDS